MSRKKVAANGESASRRLMTPAQFGPPMTSAALARDCARARRGHARPRLPRRILRAGPGNSGVRPARLRSITSTMLSGLTRMVDQVHGLRQVLERRGNLHAEHFAALGIDGDNATAIPGPLQVAQHSPPELVGRSPAPTTAMLSGFRKLLMPFTVSIPHSVGQPTPTACAGSSFSHPATFARRHETYRVRRTRPPW